MTKIYLNRKIKNDSFVSNKLVIRNDVSNGSLVSNKLLIRNQKVPNKIYKGLNTHKLREEFVPEIEPELLSYKEDYWKKVFPRDLNNISEDDFKNILAHIPTKSSFKRARNEMALKVGYYLAVRTEELVEPNYGNFDIKKLKEQFPNDRVGFLQEGFITITGKGYKTRSVPIFMELKKDLWRFLYGDLRKHVGKNLFEGKKGVPLGDSSFGTKLFRQSVNEYLSNNVVTAKLRESYERWVWHSLRHTCATNFVTYCEESKSDPFFDIPQWLGHADEETTKLYICAEALLHKRLETIKKLDSMSIKPASQGA